MVVCVRFPAILREDLEGFHRYFFLCYVIVVGSGRKALKAQLVKLEMGEVSQIWELFTLCRVGVERLPLGRRNRDARGLGGAG